MIPVKRCFGPEVVTHSLRTTALSHLPSPAAGSFLKTLFKVSKEKLPAALSNEKVRL